MKRTRVGLLAVVLSSVIVVAGQQPAQQPPPRFGGGVEMVVLDVSVLDRDRGPVRGLTPEDFLVLESWKPQAITTFSAVDLPDAVAPVASWTREVAPDVRRNVDDAGRRLVLIVMDDASATNPQDIVWARRAANSVSR